jgi:hypothetical protein
MAMVGTAQAADTVAASVAEVEAQQARDFSNCTVAADQSSTPSWCPSTAFSTTTPGSV